MGTATAMSLPRMTLPTLRSLGCSLCPVASSVTLSRYAFLSLIFEMQPCPTWQSHQSIQVYGAFVGDELYSNSTGRFGGRFSIGCFT